MTSTDGTLKPSPISTAVKPRVYDRATVWAFGVGVAVIVRFGLTNEFTLWHGGLSPKLERRMR